MNDELFYWEVDICAICVSGEFDSSSNESRRKFAQINDFIGSRSEDIFDGFVKRSPIVSLVHDIFGKLSISRVSVEFVPFFVI